MSKAEQTKNEKQVHSLREEPTEREQPDGELGDASLEDVSGGYGHIGNGPGPGPGPGG